MALKQQQLIAQIYGEYRYQTAIWGRGGGKISVSICPHVTCWDDMPMYQGFVQANTPYVARLGMVVNHYEGVHCY